MQRFKPSSLLAVLLVVLVTPLLGMRPATASSVGGIPTLRCGHGKWNIVAIPNSANPNSNLYTLATISPNDIWTVGLDYPNRVLSSSHTLTEHWNGVRWSIVPSPNFGKYSNHLYGVAAVSSHDVWAVGDYFIDKRGSGGKTLIEHWDGTHWSIIPSPNVGNRFSELYMVAAVSSNDVWAVGNFISLSPYQNQELIEHWNGTKWSVVKGAHPGVASNSLSGITVVTANDIWVVGNYAQSNGHDMTLTEHWNGTRWTFVPSPNVGKFPNDFDAVAAVSANDIWAVGSYAASPGNIDFTLTEHWNGSKWSVVPSQNPETESNYLQGVAVVTANNIWAVGYAYDFNTNPTTLIEHWNGSKWSVVPSPKSPATSRQPVSRSDTLGT